MVRQEAVAVPDTPDAFALLQFFFAWEDYGMVSLEQKDDDFFLRLYVEKMPEAAISKILLK